MTARVLVSPEAGAQIRAVDEWWRHLYYVVAEETVFVLSVWSAVRGAGPDLRWPPR